MTIPRVLATAPAKGDRWAAPWMEWIGWNPGAMENEKTKSEDGVWPDSSVTSAATTVTAQDSAGTSGASGWSV